MSGIQNWSWLCGWALLAASCEPSPCDCPHPDEAAARVVFEKGAYDFSHEEADAANAVREGRVTLDGVGATIEYRSPDGRMHRAVYRKRDVSVDKY